MLGTIENKNKVVVLKEAINYIKQVSQQIIIQCNKV